jgi:hypothetical protein
MDIHGVNGSWRMELHSIHVIYCFAEFRKYTDTGRNSTWSMRRALSSWYRSYRTWPKVRRSTGVLEWLIAIAIARRWSDNVWNWGSVSVLVPGSWTRRSQRPTCAPYHYVGGKHALKPRKAITWASSHARIQTRCQSRIHSLAHTVVNNQSGLTDWLDLIENWYVNQANPSSSNSGANPIRGAKIDWGWLTDWRIDRLTDKQGGLSNLCFCN